MVCDFPFHSDMSDTWKTWMLIGSPCTVYSAPACNPMIFPPADPREMIHKGRLRYPADHRQEVRCKGDHSKRGLLKCINGAWDWDGPELSDCPHYVESKTYSKISLHLVISPLVMNDLDFVTSVQLVII